MISHRSLPPFLIAASFGLAVLVSACVEKGAPTKASFTGPAKLLVVGGDSVNWGRVAPGDLKRDLKLVNVGGDTLHIKDVHPSCGCTTAPLDKKELAPGDTATVSISLDAKYRTGLQHKSLTITTNDSARPSLVIPLTAEIERDLTVTPDIFPPVMVKKVGEEGTTSVTLRNTGQAPINVEPPTLAPSSLLVRFDMSGPRTLAPGDSMTLAAHVKLLKPEGGSAQITMATSSKLVPKLELTIAGQVEAHSTAGAAPIKPSDLKRFPAPKSAIAPTVKPGTK